MSDFRVFINFKTYSQGTGEKAAGLVKICEEISKEWEISVTPIVQATDIYRVKQLNPGPVWVQHVDPQLPGKFTGWINLEAVKEAGAQGTLLNHSEHPIPPGMIKQVLARAQGLGTMVCAKTLGQIEKLVKLKPDLIAYEIAELVGGQTSITDANPKAIKRAVEICGRTPLIVGAGIHQSRDLIKARQLGASGVLVSSDIVLAEDPKGELLELVSAQGGGL